MEQLHPGEMGISVKVKPEGQHKSWFSGKMLETWQRWKDKIPLAEQYDIDAATRFLQAHYETEQFNLAQWQAQMPPQSRAAAIVLDTMGQNRSSGYWIEGPFSEQRIEIYHLVSAKKNAPPFSEMDDAAIWLERPSAWLTCQSGMNVWILWAMRLRCGLMQRDIDQGNLMMLWYLQALQELEATGADLQGILDF